MRQAQSPLPPLPLFALAAKGSQTASLKRISLAPMIAKTEPRFRYFIRSLFPEMWLYTEMINSGAIIHGQPQRFLQLDTCEAPIALQIGTHSPEEAYQAVLFARQYSSQQNCSFAEYNLNAGCPSDRVQNRNIGAILMNDSCLVSEILAAMQQATIDSQGLYQANKLPIISLKHRLGIQQVSRQIDLTQPEQLYRFIEKVALHCDRLIVHARIAILDGLDPKQNREIPPLNHALVLQLRKDFCPLPVELNGGLQHFSQINELWQNVDGVMLGRVTYENTWQLFYIRREMIKAGFLSQDLRYHACQTRSELVKGYADYLEQFPSEQSLPAQIWPLLNIWYSLPEARRWRRLLSPPYPRELQRLSCPEAASQLARQAVEVMGELEQKYEGQIEL